jgi:hypothetical protein
MKKIYLLFFVFWLCSCNQFYFAPYYTSSHAVDAPVAAEKYYFKVDEMIFLDTIPTKLTIEKIFIKSIAELDDTDNSLPQGSFRNKSINNAQLIEFERLFRNSLGKNVEFENMISLFWTNKNLPVEFAFKSFAPNEITLKDLLLFNELKPDEKVFLPLICYFHNEDKKAGQTFADTYKLIIAFYIFDKNQIYYAKSVGLSKTNFIQNSINPKDFTFLQSEWDYLVYEALRPLLEKGVKLEIVGRE